MLKANADLVSVDHISGVVSGPSLPSVVAFVRRNWLRVILFVAGTVAISIVYLLTEPPTYTAQGVVSAEVRRPTQFELTPSGDDGGSEPMYLQSQLEVLRSDSVLLAVVRKLGLADDGSFFSQQRSLFDSIKGFIKGIPAIFTSQDEIPPTKEQMELGAVAVMRNDLVVQRVPLTNVLTITFSSRRADLTSDVVNSVIEAYIQDQMSFRLSSATLASNWLQSRVHELREQAKKAAQDVQAYKEENGIVDTERGLVSSQQVEQLTTQVVSAISQAAETKARFDGVREILKDGSISTMTESAYNNEGIARLRTEYLEAKKVEASLIGRVNNDHPTMTALRERMASIQSAINDEFKRIAESLESEHAIAVRRERELRSSLASVVQDAATLNKAMVPARELEATAETYKALYEAFLRRSAELLQQQSFPGTQVRILSPATMPTSPSGPKAPLIILGAVAFGTILGLGAGFTRERMANALRTQSDVRAYLGLQIIGILPRVRTSRLKEQWSLIKNSPRSRFAEQLGALAVLLLSPQEVSRRKVIGVTSAVPREGKTTLAATLAMSLSLAGYKVLLVDGDFRSSIDGPFGLNKDATTLADILTTSNRPLKVASAAGGAFDIIPAGSPTDHINSCALLSSEQMCNLIDKCRDVYDFTILDLPAQLPVADARAVAHVVDDYILVVEWDRTNRNAVRRAVDLLQEVGGSIIGCVFNKVDERAYYREEGLIGRGGYDRAFKPQGIRLKG